MSLRNDTLGPSLGLMFSILYIYRNSLHHMLYQLFKLLLIWTSYTLSQRYLQLCYGSSMPSWSDTFGDYRIKSRHSEKLSRWSLFKLRLQTPRC